MIRLVLLLLGADFVRRHGPWLAVLGLLWGAIGIGLFIDALDGVLVFPLTLFGWLLLLESLATLFLASSGLGAQRTLRYVKGGLFLLISLLIVSRQPVSNMLLALLFGAAFALGGAMQMASAWLVRFPRWRWSVAGSIGQIAIAVFLIQPYPTHYAGTVVYCLGLGLMFSGWSMIWLAARSRRLTAHSSISQMSLRNSRHDRPLDAGQYTANDQAVAATPAALPAATPPQAPGAALTVMCGRLPDRPAPRRGTVRSWIATSRLSMPMASFRPATRPWKWGRACTSACTLRRKSTGRPAPSRACCAPPPTTTCPRAT